MQSHQSTLRDWQAICCVALHNGDAHSVTISIEETFGPQKRTCFVFIHIGHEVDCNFLVILEQPQLVCHILCVQFIELL